MNGDRPVYNVQKRANAGTAATFRVAVAAYIFYLGYKILRDQLQGVSTLPAWVAWLAGIVFIGGALAFCFYTYERYRADLAAAVVKTDAKKETET